MPTTRKERRKEEAGRRELLRQLNDVIFRMRQEYILFNNETEPDLIEECIYNINSLQARYAYLLKQAKAAGMENLSVLKPEDRIRH